MEQKIPIYHSKYSFWGVIKLLFFSLFFFGILFIPKTHAAILYNSWVGSSTLATNGASSTYTVVVGGQSSQSYTGDIFIRAYVVSSSVALYYQSSTLPITMAPSYDGSGIGSIDTGFSQPDNSTVYEIDGITINTGDYIGVVEQGGDGFFGVSSPYSFDIVNGNTAQAYVGSVCVATTLSEAENCAYSPPAPPVPIINFVFPVNGTTTPPFDFLSAQITNLKPTSTYSVTEVTTYNGKQLLGNEIHNASGAYIMRFGYGTPFPVILDNGWGSNISMISQIFIYETTNGIQGPNPAITSTTIQWNLIPYIHDGFNEVNGTTTILTKFPIWVQATSTETVTTPWDGTLSNGTTTFPGKASPTSTFCTSPDSGAIGGGIAYGICYGWNFIKEKASDLTSSLTQTIWATAQKTFPFSIPLTLYANIEQSASSTLATTTDATIEVTMPYCTPLCVATTSRTLIILSSNTTVPYVHDEWFTLQQYLLTFAFIVIVFKTIRHEA